MPLDAPPASLTPAPHRACIVGASSGIGRALAVELVHRGYHVAVLGRRAALLDALCSELNTSEAAPVAFAFPHDVTQYNEVPALFDQICDTLGGLDVLVYTAGVMPAGGEEDFDFPDDRKLVQVNLLGAMAWFDQAAELFVRLKGGTIVGIGSVAGERGRRKSPAYGMTKAALATFLEGLRNRLSQHGIRVVTIKPGFVDTEMVRDAKSKLWMISAPEAARRIAEAIHHGAEVQFIPKRWGFAMWIIRNIPSGIFRHLNI